MLWDNSLTVVAVRCLFGEVGANLVRFTGELRGADLFLQWILLPEATEDEIEDYRCVGTEILAHYEGMAHEEFLTVRTVQEAKAIPALANPFFCRNLGAEI